MIRKLSYSTFELWFKPMKWAVIISCFFFFSHVHSKELYYLNHGTWALSHTPDPFLKKHPVVSYLPHGTVIFNKKNGPSYLDGYVSVETQYGNRLLILEEQDIDGDGKRKEIIQLMDKVMTIKNSPHSGGLVFNINILCPWKANIISIPSDDCFKYDNRRRKVGRGWFFSRNTSIKGAEWYNLRAILDKETSDDLVSLGLNLNEISFDIPIEEFKAYENKGYLTDLTIEHPKFQFIQESNPIHFKCGVEKITEEVVRKNYSTNGGVILEAQMPMYLRFVNFINAKLNIDIHVGKKEEKSQLEKFKIDTSEQSYLFQVFKMLDSKGAVTVINITKVFECIKSPKPKVGERIVKVIFEVENPQDNDTYEFDNPDLYDEFSMAVKGRIPRPYFISVNDREKYTNILKLIVENHGVSVQLAHFFLSHINQTCKSDKREICLKDKFRMSRTILSERRNNIPK